MNTARELIADETLTILVVADVAANLSVLSQMVARLGHRVVLARGGDEAVEQFQLRAPDLILMGVWRPSGDDFQATERIRSLLGPHWVPVIYVTAQDLVGGVERAIEAGGDDFLAKPIEMDLLRAKLQAAARTLALQRENARQRAELERYFHDTEEEQRIASGLMHRLVQMDTIRDPVVEYRLTPALHLSGDVVAAARTPGNRLHVLLADGTGHGLAASLGVMPVVQPFYAMTQKGFGLATIAKEMNRKVREWLPVGRFIATTLIEVDPHGRIVSVWNGGNPPVILLAEDGTELARFASSHLPLGIMRSREMDLSFDRFSLKGDAQLIVCSDGVVEATSPSGAQLGVERIIEAAAAAPRAARMRAINQALDEHLAGRKPHDDLSIVFVDCGAEIGKNQGKADPVPNAGARALGQWRFQIELSPDELRQIDVVPMLGAMLERMMIPGVHRSNLFVVLSELFNNALDHGVLMLDSGLKSGGGMERYLSMRATRLTALSAGWVRVGLQMTECGGEQCLRIEVQDSGEGFDWRGRSGRDCNDNPHGRGLALVQRLCKSVEYRGTGSEVVAIYSLAARD